jgi:hypothetical protein
MATAIRRGLEHIDLYRSVRRQPFPDSRPLHLCPVCLRKLLWNLQAEPVPYLQRLETFCRQHGLEEADWYARSVEALGG